jgi:type VI protein secretion system component VasK
MEMAYEDSRDPAKKRILTIDGEEVELMDGDEQWMRMTWTLADAARQLLKGGK